MSSEQWIAEEFIINGIVYPLKVSPKVCRKFHFWGWRTYKYFDAWQQHIGQFFEYRSSAHLPTYLEKLPCVYILYNNDEIVYVGQTVQLATRISGHIGKEFDYVQVIVCLDAGLRTRIEQHLIKTFAPAYNKAGNPQPHAKPIHLINFTEQIDFFNKEYSREDPNFLTNIFLKNIDNWRVHNHKFYPQHKPIYQRLS